MDVKIKQAPTGTELRRLSFLSDFKEELKKVTWTSKPELILCTKVVVGATFFLGMGIYVVDLMIKSALQIIKFVGHLIGG